MFGRKSRGKGRWSASQAGRLEHPGVVLLLERLEPVDGAAVCRALAAIEPLKLAPKYTPGAAPDAGGAMFAGRFEFDSHVIDVIGVDAPVPQPALDRTVESSAWTGKGREAMLAHRAHCVLLHQGGGSSPLEKHIALFKLAAALGGERGAGVLNEAAWTCAPDQVVREFATPAMLKACREQIPPIVFTGFIKFLDEGRVWFATRGQHLFGAPDFLMEGAPDDKPGDVLDMFMNIFLYLLGSDRELMPGHTMQIADEIYLRFGALDPAHPHHGALQGPGRTLTITRIGKDDINR